jgi:hypothetical protein
MHKMATEFTGQWSSGRNKSPCGFICRAVSPIKKTPFQTGSEKASEIKAARYACGRGGSAQPLKSVSRLNCAPRRGILKVAREVGVGTGTVQHIKQETNGPFAGAAAA